MRARLREVGAASRAVVGWQRWDDILFLHWPVAPGTLRPLVDERLELDLIDGAAWVSLTPFTMRRARLRGLPRLPLLSTFHEVNLRTYVRAGGVPGIWFFSLDAASAPAVALARATLGLPYRWAAMARGATDERRWYRSRRRGSPAVLEVEWRAGEAVPDPPGALDEFLADRHALYTTVAGALVRMRVRHAPWRLREVRLDALAQTCTREAGIPVAERPALARCSEGIDVEVLAPERVGAPGRALRR